MKIKITNVGLSDVSTDFGLVPAAGSVTVNITPDQLARSHGHIKTMTDSGNITVEILNDPEVSDSIELTVPPLYPKMVAIATVAYDQTFYNNTGIASIVRTGEGRYRLTLDTPVTMAKRSIQLSVPEAAPRFVYCTDYGDANITYIDVCTDDKLGATIDSGFSIVVWQLVA